MFGPIVEIVIIGVQREVKFRLHLSDILLDTIFLIAFIFRSSVKRCYCSEKAERPGYHAFIYFHVLRTVINIFIVDWMYLGPFQPL